MTPRHLLLSSARRLETAGIPNPESDASLLLSALTGRPPLSLRVDLDTELDADCLERFEAYLLRREKREPLQYILGSAPFCGLTFSTDARALIPRPETALLVCWALEILSERAWDHAPRILDLCCGSGCIGLSLKHHFPAACVTLSDLSPEALSLSRENGDALHLEAEYIQGDLFAPLRGRVFDLILSNPPYIPSEECPDLQAEVLFEPLSALDGGRDGLDFYRRIAEEAPAHLAPKGLLMLEAGIREAEEIRKLLLNRGAVSADIRQDFSSVDRMLLAKYE